jgi:RNA polymerase sigma-70 factor (ECF subfamily)
MPEGLLDDAEAVRRLQRGDEDALVALYDKYQGRVFRFAIRLLGRVEDAEEVVADAFLQVFRHCRGYREGGTFSGWLFRIARNLCFARLRSSRRLAPMSFDDLPGGDDALPLAEPAPDPELSIVVRDALAALPPDYRRVLMMRDLEGLTNAETALVLRRTPASTKSLHFRARQALRDVVARALNGEE